MKKFLALFLSLLLVISIVPTAAFATGTVAGTTINGQLNISGTTGDASGDGWSWIASTKTLTLTDLTITNDGNYKSAIILPTIADTDTVTVVLEGDNYISDFNRTNGHIFAVGYDADANSRGTLLLTGDGSLTVTDCGMIQNEVFRNVIIDGITFTATVVDGLTIAQTFTIQNNANVTITCTGSSSSAVWALGGMVITESTLTVSAPNSKSAVLYASKSGNNDPSIVIEDSTVNVSDGLGWAIRNNSDGISITDSTITIGSDSGIFTGDTLSLAGNVAILTEDNMQVAYCATLDADDLDDDSNIQGYVAEGSEFYYLTDYTLTSEFSVATGKTLTIPDGVTLALANDVTLSSVDDGAIINNGAIVVPCGSSGGVASGALSSGSNAVEENHTYGDPVFTWSEDYTTATATFTCTACGDVQTVEAVVTSEIDGSGNTVYTATIAGTTYTDTQTVAAEPTTTTTSKSDIYTTLSRIQASYTAVQAAIEKANALNPSDYENFSAVTEAIEAVDWSLNVLNQKQVNSYAEAIEEAIENLVPASTTEEIVEIDEPVEAGETDIE